MAIGKHWAVTMTIPEAEELSHEIAREIIRDGQMPDLGLANGALLPTKVVADTLGVPFRILEVRRQASRYKQKLLRVKRTLHIPVEWVLWGPLLRFWKAFEDHFSKLEVACTTFVFDVQGLSIAVIDDCIVTGGSVRYVAEELKKLGARRVSINVLCWCKGESGDTPEGKPDVFLHRHIQI